MTSHAPSSTARRGSARRLAFVAVLLAPALAACGFGAQTDQIYQAAQGVDDRSTSVKVLNALIVASEDGSGTFAGTFVNETLAAETLTAVTADGVTASDTSAIAVPAQGLLNLGKAVEGPKGTSGPLLVLTGTPIEIGRFVDLTFEFAGAGRVEMSVHVVSADRALGDEFVDVPLPPGSKPAPTAIPSDEPSEEGAAH